MRQLKPVRIALVATALVITASACGGTPQAESKPATAPAPAAATLVVTAIPKPTEMAAVKEYLGKVLPILKRAGGTLVRRLKTNKIIDGRPAGMTLVMDFKSPEAVTAAFESDAYKALLPVRDRGFSEMNILLTQGM